MKYIWVILRWDYLVTGIWSAYVQEHLTLPKPHLLVFSHSRILLHCSQLATSTVWLGQADKNIWDPYFVQVSLISIPTHVIRVPMHNDRDRTQRYTVKTQSLIPFCTLPLRKISHRFHISPSSFSAEVSYSPRSRRTINIERVYINGTQPGHVALLAATWILTVRWDSYPMRSS